MLMHIRKDKIMIIKKDKQRLNEQLNRLFIKESFKKEINLHRKELGIPKNGFKSFKEYLTWLGDDRGKIINTGYARIGIIRKFGLPINYSLSVEAYLMLGKNFDKYDSKIPFEDMGYTRSFDNPGFACAMEVEEDYQCVSVKIYAGASERDVINYIKEHYNEIQENLKKFKLKVDPIRSKRRSKRDEEIYKYFTKGLIDKQGHLTRMQEKEIPKHIVDLDSDLRRKIILQQTKNRN